MAEARRGRMTVDQFYEEVFMDSDSENELELALESDGDCDGEANTTVTSNTDSIKSDLGAILDKLPIPESELGGAYDDAWLTPFTHNTGPLKHDGTHSELDIFCDIFTDELFIIMTNETNRYARQYIEQLGGVEVLRTYSRVKRWVEVDAVEMRAFVAILILMGIDRRANYEQYWTTDGFLEMSGFRNVMSRDRFLLILQFFHLVDNNEMLPRGHPQYDRIFKVRSLMNIVIPAWQGAFHPGREVSVDESIIPFKGRSYMVQCCQNKPHRWGLNTWVLADARTRYTWNWDLYAGKQGVQRPEHGVMYGVVTDICRPLYGLGHHVYMDNRFASPVLFDELARQGCGACGSFSVNHQGVPDAVKQAQRTIIKDDPATVVHHGEKMFVVWKDKRTVSVLSTVHDDSTFMKRVRARNAPENHREVIKPCAIELYTKYMDVDIADQHMWYFLTLHRAVKWWKKAYIALQEVSLDNALIIFREVNVSHTTPQRFRLNVVKGLLANYSRNRAVLRPIRNVPSRLTERHFIEINPTKTSSGRQSFPDCAVCSNRKVKRHQTEYRCKECRIAMCPHPCFKLFHTKLNFKTDCCKQLHQS